MKTVCGWCKTLYPEILKDTDDICLDCRKHGNDKFAFFVGEL